MKIFLTTAFSALLTGLIMFCWLSHRHRKTTATWPACVRNLIEIDSCKGQWARENRKSKDDTPSWEDLRSYLSPRWTNFPKCPNGGTYVLSRVGAPPRCSIGGPE